MAIAVIWSSPNEDGLTAAAKNKVIDGIRQAGKQAEEIWLNRLNLQGCPPCGDGWGNCREQGVCILKDDFQATYQKLVQAESLVWITPVYWHDVSENLKRLLDRLRRCETKHTHFLEQKKCLLAACAGGSGLGAIECLHTMEETIRHMKMTAVDRIPVNQFNRSYMLPALKQAGLAFAQLK